MKPAEALAPRAAAVRRVEQLRVRVVGSARYQEGEEPAGLRRRPAGPGRLGCPPCGGDPQLQELGPLVSPDPTRPDPTRRDLAAARFSAP
ncbi:hypothetical protein AB0I39_27625 [Kitasatospora purpeofusca]|uniref:hypothetical protein n=1 Tax=Kitasatospora purpeofusca TaxID=67352 RepID=UPI0033CCE6BA